MSASRSLFYDVNINGNTTELRVDERRWTTQRKVSGEDVEDAKRRGHRPPLDVTKFHHSVDYFVKDSGAYRPALPHEIAQIVGQIIIPEFQVPGSGMGWVAQGPSSGVMPRATTAVGPGGPTP